MRLYFMIGQLKNTLSKIICNQNDHRRIRIKIIWLCIVTGLHHRHWTNTHIYKDSVGEVVRGMLHFCIVAFQGLVISKPDTNTVLRYRLISKVNRLACISWCLAVGPCMGIAVDEAETECFFSTSPEGKLVPTPGYKQYEIRRVCSRRAEGEQLIIILFL